MIVDRFRAMNSEASAPAVKKKTDVGKKIRDFLHNDVLQILEPPKRGGWKGGMKPLKYTEKRIKLHDDRSHKYSGIGVWSGKIAQRILNERSHMVTMGNKGNDFDILMIYYKRMWRYVSKGLIMGLLGFFVLFSSLTLWPASVPFFAYSAFFCGQYKVVST